MDLSRFLPSLVRSSPADGARDVPLQPDIELEFSVAIHPDALTTAGISSHLMLIEAVTERSIPLVLLQPTSPTRTKLLRLRPSVQLDPAKDYLLIILPTLPAYTGRTSGVRTVIGFRTVDPALQIPVPLTLQPGHNAMVTALPVQLAWDDWPNPPAGYTLLYEVHLSRDERFVDIVWQTVTGNTQVTVPVASTPEGGYQWRVRIVLRKQGTEELVVGRWSETAGFFVRLAPLPQPSSETDALGITTSFDHIVMALQSEWPPMELYQVPSDYTQVRWEWRGADGYPSWEWQPLPFTLQVTDSFPTDGVVDRLVLVPSEPIGVSRVYRLTVWRQEQLLWERMFYANLRPLYCHPDVVKYRVSAIAQAEGIDDDDICFYIFRKSLEANRHYYRWMFAGWAGPTESVIRSIDVGQYFAVQRWVELQATIEILSYLLLRLSSRMGARQRLGDYFDEYEADALREIRELRKQLQKESILWLSEFSKLRAVAVTASKGSLNPAYLPGGPHEHPRRDWRRNNTWRY